MEKEDILRNTESVKIDNLEGEVPFTVVKVPKTEYDVEEDSHILYDHYYLRTNSSLNCAINEASEEFKRYGFSEGRFNPSYLKGKICFKDEEIVINPEWSSVKGFNFWLVEGLIGEFYEKLKSEKFPKIRTNRKKTKKLYKMGISDIEEPLESKESIVDLVKDSEEPCLIEIAPTYLDEDQAWQVAKARTKGKHAIMNYGYIWRQHSSFFRDPNSGQWYQLLNREIYSDDEREDLKKFNKKLPNVGIVTKIDGYTFREADKVAERRGLFFDGSIQDVFRILAESGTKFSEGILK